MCNRRRLIISGAFASLVALALVVQTYAIPPSAWQQIRIGATPDQVQVKWPAVIQDLQDIKGDFCFRKVPLGSWRLQIIYGPDHRVSKKICILRLGTRENYQEIHFNDTST